MTLRYTNFIMNEKIEPKKNKPDSFFNYTFKNHHQKPAKQEKTKPPYL